MSEQTIQSQVLASVFDHMTHRYNGGCGNGWNEIILRLHTDLMRIDPNYQLHQFKEKFGTLRFYASCTKESDSKMFQDRIDQAEEESKQTCESCGLPGELRNNRSWLKTLCNDCDKTG